MQIQDLMTTSVETLSPDDTVDAARKLMDSKELSMIPVTDNQQLVGVLSEQDLSSGSAGQQDPAATKVSAVLSEDMQFCYGDEDSDEVSERMAKLGVQRLPVVDRDQKLVGSVSVEELTTRAGTSGANTVKNEGQNKLDEAVDETFPGSDPISPA